MLPSPRPAASRAALLLLLVAPGALAQSVLPPDTLETPYEDPPPREPPTAPPVHEEPVVTDDVTPPTLHEDPSPPPVAADTRPLGPIRARRRLALMGEVGWNGLAGFGPTLTFHAHPRLSLDLGGGFSLLGWKIGLRGRFNLLEGPVTPFVGAGMIGSAGLSDFPIEEARDANGNEPAREAVTVRVRPSYFLQTVAGVDWTSRGGFTLLGCVGYAHLFNRDNVEVIAGTPTREHEMAFDFAFRSSIVLTVGLGYSFE